MYRHLPCQEPDLNQGEGRAGGIGGKGGLVSPRRGCWDWGGGIGGH